MGGWLVAAVARGDAGRWELRGWGGGTHGRWAPQLADGVGDRGGRELQEHRRVAGATSHAAKLLLPLPSPPDASPPAPGCCYCCCTGATQVVVPTDDGKVRQLLRQLAEPVTLFGEREVSRSSGGGRRRGRVLGGWGC